MQNKSSIVATTEKSEKTQDIHAPDPAPPNWTAIVAIILSFFALVKSFFTDRRATKNQKANSFEANYGNLVRDALREFEKNIKDLRSFSYRSEKTVEQLRLEITDLRGDWISAADDLILALDELKHCELVEPNWVGAFTHFASRAENYLESLSDVDVDTKEKLQRKAKNAYEAYKDGVTALRSRLQKQRDSF
jgi:hypothetical protein